MPWATSRDSLARDTVGIDLVGMLNGAVSGTAAGAAAGRAARGDNQRATPDTDDLVDRARQSAERYFSSENDAMPGTGAEKPSTDDA